MKRQLHFLVLALFLSAGVLTQVGCSSSEPAIPPVMDSDGDGLNDADEIARGLDPNSADSDGDGVSDADEINIYNTDPLSNDSDNDGLTDGDEVNSYKTDPNKADTDDDGLSDGDEVNKYKTDPLSADGDADNDGVSDVDEIMTHMTDPNNADSDGDGFTDGQELDMGTNPTNGSDPVFISMDDFNTITFAFDRSQIRDNAAADLAENVELLTNAPAFRVRVDAYTDHVGGDQYNLRLSLRRAKAVVDFYVANGIAADRIESQGLGKAPVPCMDSTPEKGCEANRRAESHPISTLKYSPKM